MQTPVKTPGDLSPNAREWLDSISALGRYGLIITRPDLEPIYSNSIARSILELPDTGKVDSESNFQCLVYMAERGDFGDVDPLVAAKTHYAGLKAFAKGDTSVKLQSTFMLETGKIISIKRHRMPGGYVATIMVDVTEKRTHEEGLKIAMKLGKSGYWRYTLAHDKFEIFGDYLPSILSEAEYKTLLVRGFWEFIHPDDVENCKRVWKATIKNGEPFKEIIRIDTVNNGTRMFRFHARPIISKIGVVTSVICNFEDSTDDILLKEELRQAKETAEKTLAAQSNFLARLAHEIRTPMNAVVGIADALVQKAVDENLSSKLKLIQHSADNIMNILEGTLDHTKLDVEKLALNPQPENIGDTLRAVSQVWKSRASQTNVNIRLHVDASVPETVLVDRFRYEQCVNNLLSNAIKFAPNGRVDVILTALASPRGNMKLVLAVKDTGIGMTAEQQTRIFDAYTQADVTISAQYGGTGLGMNITKSIVEMMGGDIVVRSELGKGSVFVLTIPLVEEEPEVNDIDVSTPDGILDHLFEEEVLPQTPYSNLRVLVVDDNATNHIVMESLLETVVRKIHFAADGQKAIDLIRKEEIDVVFMDIHMPIMDGIEATLNIRKSQEPWQDIHIVALTADPQYMQLRLCRNIGMNSTLSKPVKMSSVIGVLDEFLELRGASPNHNATKAATA